MCQRDFKRILVFVTCCLCLVALSKSESSRFLRLPQNQRIVEGKTVEFNCEATPATNLKYSWTKNGQPIHNTSRVHQMGSNLQIESVRPNDDGGVYVCIATNTASGARLASPPATLNVIWIKTATVQLLSNNRNEIMLKCQVESSSPSISVNDDEVDDAAAVDAHIDVNGDGDGDDDDVDVEGKKYNKLQIEWFRNTVKLSPKQKNIKINTNRLIIQHPSKYDSGLYRCIATNEAGSFISRKGYMLKWTHERGEDAVGGGGGTAATTNCMPQLKKHQKFPFELIRDEIFLCRGKRGGAGGMLPTDDRQLPTAADIVITKAPPARQVVKESEQLELPCAYEIPAKYMQKDNIVILRWGKDGKLLRQIELNVAAMNIATTTATIEPAAAAAGATKDVLVREDSRIVVNRSNGSLKFNTVIASDAGQYVCQLVVDGYRPITSRASDLQVIEQLKFMPQPTSKNLELASVGKVHCKAQGTPMPQVEWIREPADLSFPDTIDDINGTLIFKNVSAEHRGNYTCIARNSQGQINATVMINVVVAPKFTVTPGDGDTIEGVEGGNVVLHCQAIGDPKPTIQWDKDLQYLSEDNIDQNRFRILSNGTLEIHELHADDDGNYGCTIGNSAGLKREEVKLMVKAGDGFLITRAVLITMSVAFAYIILVVGLMIWCRYRRQARKARLSDTNKDDTEAGGGGGGDGGSKIAENEPCLPAEYNNKEKKQRHKMNGNNNPRGSGNEAQKSDDTACSNHSKGSKKSHAFDRSAISELIQIGRGEFGDVFVGKIKSNVVAAIQADEKKDADNEKQHQQQQQHHKENGLNAAEKRRSKTSMDDIEEIKEEHEHENENGNIVADSGGTVVAIIADNNSTQQHNTLNDEQQKFVLVKALNKVKDEYEEFKRQIEMFRAITHKGVVRLYGLCREKDPHFMVLEYTDWGDLKQFLLATAGKVNTSANSAKPPALKTAQILAVAYQIARGMDAIYRARFIHKDLATRNCVISSDFVVKVSYAALCKDKYSREYHKHRNTLLPIRWLAPECIMEDEYTTKSDIFAFGVVVWELFSQATKMPFEELSNEEVIQRSQAEKLEWTCAEGTPESLKDILHACWKTNPNERPSFSQLCSALSKAMQNGDK